MAPGVHASVHNVETQRLMRLGFSAQPQLDDGARTGIWEPLPSNAPQPADSQKAGNFLDPKVHLSSGHFSRTRGAPL